ncbi:MAG TPA: PAS domain S-box protein [Sedimentisphaerales bacterium]|nr:PAS domain S-box protein [Sedimentisphaerales bacterium]
MKEQTENLRNVTAKLQTAEHDLQASEEKYRQLVERADCIIMRRSIDGEIIFFNEFAQKFFGYSEREIIGKNIVGTIVRETDSYGRNLVKMTRDIGRQPELYATNENESICRNGRRVWIAWANKPICDKEGNITEILCVGHDITKRKGMENELRLLATIVKNSPDPTTVQDFDGNIISWNHGAEHVYGYSEEETLGMNVSKIIPEHKRGEIDALIESLKKGDNIGFLDTQRIAKDGRMLDILLIVMMIKDEAGKACAIATSERDITEHRRLEREVLSITERERKSIGREMHDSMGQALTGIAVKSKGLALKLADKSSEDSKEALAISKLANKAIVQMRGLTRMLYPVDIEAGGLASALNTLAANTEKVLGVKCRFNCSMPVSVDNHVESRQLFRIAEEAITNAIKHGKAKTIHINLDLKDERCILSVKNDGRDFPKTPPRKRKGLGLKIMEYRTGMIGGSLDIRKGDKGGTIVTCAFTSKKR